MTKYLSYIVGYFNLDTSLDKVGLHIHRYEYIFLICLGARDSDRYHLLGISCSSHISLLVRIGEGNPPLY
jgi:hypothetical protein